MSIRYRLVFCQEKNNRLKMKINNVALPISLAVILTGCVPHASNRNITAIEVVKPAMLPPTWAIPLSHLLLDLKRTY